jgi:hypothetical protein
MDCIILHAQGRPRPPLQSGEIEEVQMSDVSDGEIVDEAVLNGSAAASVPGPAPAAAAPYHRQPSGSPVSPQAADAFFEVDPEDPGVRQSHSLCHQDWLAVMPKQLCTEM